MHVSHPILKSLWQGKSSSTLLVLRHNRAVPELICAHTQSICMALCKVHSCTFAQKRRLFYLKNRTSRRHCYSRVWYATQTHSHTCQHPLPFPWGTSWQLHPESLHRLPVSRSPLASHPDRTLATPTAFLHITRRKGFRCSIQPNSHCLQHLPMTGKLFRISVNPWGTAHVLNGCLKG